MARYNNYSDESDGKVSSWNSSAYKVKRLHETIDLMNKSKLNPLAWNVEYNCHCWNVWLTCIDTLYAEVESKLKDNEKKYAEVFKLAMVIFFNKNPIVIERQDKNHKTKSEINHLNWEATRKLLTKWELLVRQFHDDHGLDTGYDDMDDGL